MHISKKHQKENLEEITDTFDDNIIIDRYSYLSQEDGDAYGNDATYWHDEFVKVVEAKDILETGMRKQFNTMKSNYHAICESRDHWKTAYADLKKEHIALIKALNETSSRVPKGISWPAYTDGELVCIGDKIKLTWMISKIKQEYTVEEITFGSSGDFRLYVRGASPLCSYQVMKSEIVCIEHPDPDTERKILEDAIKHGVSLASESESDLVEALDNIVLEDILKLYQDRLEGLHKGDDIADAESSE